MAETGHPQEPVVQTDTEQFTAGLVSSLTQIYKEQAGANEKWTRQQVDRFLLQFQVGDDLLDDLTDDDRLHLGGEEVDLDAFLRYMGSSAADILKPPPADDLDAEWPLNNYWINSSQNIFLNGEIPSKSPANDGSCDAPASLTTDAYRDALLRGCRSLNIGICDGDWVPSDEKDENGEAKLTEELSGMQRLWFSALQKALDNMEAKAKDERFIHDIQQIRESWTTVYKYEPRVLDSSGATIGDFVFSDMAQTIKEHAFAASDLPLVVNLDIQCEPPQQLAVVAIINKAWSEFLVTPPPSDDAHVQLPTPAELRRKILINIKQPPHEDDSVSLGSSSFSSIFKKKADKKHEEPVKVIEPLHQLAIYTRKAPFTSLWQAEATQPTHIFTLPDAVLADVHAQAPGELFRHNRHFLMQTTPAPAHSNANPLGHWQKGVQMAALDWSVCDARLMVNEGMFAGTGGFVRKPDGYRGPQMPARRPSSSTPTFEKDPDAMRRVPPHRLLQRLAVHVLAAQDLPAPFPVDDADGIRPYATLELHAAPHLYETMAPPTPTGVAQTSARTRAMRGLGPDFQGETLDLLNVHGVIPELAFVAFRVWHEERPRDLPMGWACVRLDRLRSGYRMLRLHDMNGRPSRGQVLVRIEKRMW